MDPFLGQIMMFAGNFAPRGWAFCDGQLLPISQNTALFSILGTTYGGDGRTTFALPDLRGRVSIHPGSGPGLTSRRLGEKGGAETVTLNVNEIPRHDHFFQLAFGPGDKSTGSDNAIAVNSLGETIFSDKAPSADAVLNRDSIAINGGGQAHTNIQPFTCVNFIIALVGVYPSRS
jgi:microcystin-dependent protein